MAVQLEIARRGSAWPGDLHDAVSDFARPTGSSAASRWSFAKTSCAFSIRSTIADPIYLYLYVIFALMVPWAILLPAALVEAHHRAAHRGRAARERSLHADLFLVDVHLFHALGIAPQLLHPADSPPAAMLMRGC